MSRGTGILFVTRRTGRHMFMLPQDTSIMREYAVPYLCGNGWLLYDKKIPPVPHFYCILLYPPFVKYCD